MTSLIERLAALEAELIADPADEVPILVRVRDGRAGGGLLPDSLVIGVRGSDGKVVARRPGEKLAALVTRAAAAAPIGHPRRRLIYMCVYPPDKSCRNRS